MNPLSPTDAQCRERTPAEDAAPAVINPIVEI